MTQAKKTNIQSRKAAIQLYAAIIERKLSLSGLTNEENGASYYLKLDKQERNFVKAIVTCTLRNKAIIEHLLGYYLKKNLPNGARTLRHILHIAIAQIIYLNVSNYAAINSAVDLAKYDARTRRFASLVNAVLREITRDIEKNTIESKLQLPVLDTVPVWFKNMLVYDYGKEKAQTIIEAQANNQSIDLTVKTDPKLWAQKLNATILWENNIRLPSTYKDEITKLEGYKEGAWWVQDCAAYIPVMLMRQIKNKQIADLCSSPGGKTSQLASMGAKVMAFEINKTRINRLKTNLERLHLSVETILGDFRQTASLNSFDAVLLDAPCSSTGTIRKNCDILWTKTLEDVKDMSDLQYDLLKHAIKCTKIGGEIIFSNCSLAKIEGENLIEKILKNENNIKISVIRPDETFFQKHPSLTNFITAEGFFRITTDDFYKASGYKGAMDSFFVARLSKYK